MNKLRDPLFIPDELLSAGDPTPEPTSDPNPSPAPEASAPPAQTPSDAWWNQYSNNPVLKDNKIIQRYKTQEDALVALDNAHRTLSKKLVDIPGETAEPEAVGNFFKEIRSKLPEPFRVPESPDKYTLTATVKNEKGEDVPLQFDKSALGTVQEVCHKCGIDNQTFNSLVLAISGAQQEAPKVYKKNIENWLADRSKADPTTPTYSQFASVANKEFASWPDDVKESVKNIPADAIARIAYHYASLGQEHSFPTDAIQTNAMSIDEIQRRKDEIRRDPNYRNQLQQASGPLFDEYNKLIEASKKIGRK